MDPKTNPTAYTLTLSGTQLRIVIQALDLFSRIGIAQFEEILHAYDSGRLNGEILTAEQEHDTRDQARSFLEMAKRALTGYPGNAGHGIHSPLVSDKYRVAFDIHQVIRNLLYRESGTKHYSVDASVHQASNEPLPTITRVPDAANPTKE